MPRLSARRTTGYHGYHGCYGYHARGKIGDPTWRDWDPLGLGRPDRSVECSKAARPPAISSAHTRACLCVHNTHAEPRRARHRHGTARCRPSALRDFEDFEPLVALRPSPLVSALGTRVRIFENGVEPSAARCVDCGGIPAVVASTSIPGADIIPDFMVVGPQIAHQGAGGVLAMGFWDNFWQWSPAVSFAKC